MNIGIVNYSIRVLSLLLIIMFSTSYASNIKSQPEPITQQDVDGWALELVEETPSALSAVWLKHKEADISMMFTKRRDTKSLSIFIIRNGKWIPDKIGNKNYISAAFDKKTNEVSKVTVYEWDESGKENKVMLIRQENGLWEMHKEIK